jgi:hypothetical protein
MTATGLERTDKKSDDWNADENKDGENSDNNGNDGYRYKKDREIKIDTVDIKLKGKDTTINIKVNALETSSPRKESEDEPVLTSRKKGAYVYHMISIFDLMRIGK